MYGNRPHHQGRVTAVILASALFLLAIAAPQVRSQQGVGNNGGSSRAADDDTNDLLTLFPYFRQNPPPIPPSSGPGFGINFISSAEGPADEQQYQNARSTGATWNRWPIYWFHVEQSEGNFNWSNQDQVVRADFAHGFQINAILLGTPYFYRDSANVAPPLPTDRAPGQLRLTAAETATPRGLFAPVFSDGSDVPGPGKSINQGNVWARFVYETVNRYRPGGILAQSGGWLSDKGITHWEIWNEPELSQFWDGTLAEYARLLKVGYLAAKHADAGAQVMFGGLANFGQNDFYEDVMELYDNDPMAASYDYYHDILAMHSYSNSWQSWYHVWRGSNIFEARGLDKPVWLNESGVSAHNDYPGPVWDPQSPYRATVNEQSDYVIQSAFYAVFAGADVLFHFQLYDGCGNQPHGTDFPPHNGELCDANGMLTYDPSKPCAGDAFGLFSNPRDAACFTQHPQAESPRPYFQAYKVLTTYFRDVEPLWRRRPDGGAEEWIAFYKPTTGERVLGLWARFSDQKTAEVEAIGNSALLVRPDGSTQTLTPSNGRYRIPLPGATNLNSGLNPPDGAYPIGGRPSILIERDRTAPSASITASQLSAAGDIAVSWRGDDGLGSSVERYTVHVAVDGGQPEIWLADTTQTSATYAGEIGRNYTFSVTVYDRAGNANLPDQASAAVVPSTDP